MHIEETFSVPYLEGWKDKEDKEIFFLLKELGKKHISLIQRKMKERYYDFILENHEGNLVVKLGEYGPDGKKALRCAIAFTGNELHHYNKIRENLVEVITNFYKE